MLRLTRFEYHAPDSISEAVSLLTEYGEGAALMGGGTDLLINMKHRLAAPRHVIGLRRLPEMNSIERASNGEMVIGASVSLQRIEHDRQIVALYPALAHAASLVSTPQVRVVGTIGGNVCLDVRCNYYNQSYEWRKGIGFCMKKDSPICRVAPGGDRCWAVSSADTVPVLIALGAEASIAGSEGLRRVPIESLYQDDGLAPLKLRAGEIVTAIHLPAPRGRCVYKKFRIRQSFDFPLVGVAAWVDRAPDGTVEDVRIILTAVASYPERATSAENLLRGTRLQPQEIEAAGQLVGRQAKPMDNTAGTIFHRKRMARVLAERALSEIAGQPER